MINYHFFLLYPKPLPFRVHAINEWQCHNSYFLLPFFCWNITKRWTRRWRKKERKIFQKNLFPFHFIDNVLEQQNKKKKYWYTICFLDWGRGSVNIGKHRERIDLIQNFNLQCFLWNFVDVISSLLSIRVITSQPFLFRLKCFFEGFIFSWTLMDLGAVLTGVGGLIREFKVD